MDDVAQSSPYLIIMLGITTLLHVIHFLAFYFVAPLTATVEIQETIAIATSASTISTPNWVY
jgi:hypothetical protein